jgi:hypothetical protein
MVTSSSGGVFLLRFRVLQLAGTDVMGRDITQIDDKADISTLWEWGPMNFSTRKC